MNPPPTRYSIYVDAALIPFLVWMWRKAPRMGQPYRRRVEIAIRVCAVLIIVSYASAIVATHAR